MNEIDISFLNWFHREFRREFNANEDKAIRTAYMIGHLDGMLEMARGCHEIDRISTLFGTKTISGEQK